MLCVCVFVCRETKESYEFLMMSLYSFVETFSCRNSVFFFCLYYASNCVCVSVRRFRGTVKRCIFLMMHFFFVSLNFVFSTL